jgi:tyrosine-protein kinase Etk/Wzc
MVIALDRQIQRLHGELGELNDQVRELPNTQQEVLRLVRDVAVNTELYTSLLNTAQELRVMKAGTVGNVRVVDYAVMPSWPIAPRKSRILLLSLLLGGFIGVAAAFAKKALKAGVEDPDLIEKQINIPVYATIAHSKNQDRIYKKLESDEAKRAILAVDSPDDAAIESLRNLRTALHFGMMDVKNNCIMIAGPSPVVGKSFVSVNLAAVLTSNDKKVLLIDGDMRRGHLHKYLGIKRENGLSDFISGEIPIGQAMHQTTIKGLTLIPSGKIPPNPSELLLHKRFTNCMSVLTPRYDHIIIDSPPILAVTDATIIGQMAGGTLMVLKAGEHPMREIEQAVKRLQQAGVNVRGLLFNDVNVQSRRYGAGKYSYQYSYKKG